MEKWASQPRVRLALQTASAVLLLAVLMPGRTEIGLTDDADFYLGAALKYQAWWGSVLSGDLGALSRARIDEAFAANREHPPVAKLAMAAGHAVFHRALGWMNAIDGARMGVLLLSWLCLIFMTATVTPVLGLATGILAPWLVAAMPRLLFHMRVETLDAPMMATYFVTAGCVWLGRRDWRFALAAGLAFGLALGTKLNAPFLLVPVLFLAWLDAKPAAQWAQTPGMKLAPVPLYLAAMAIVGPIVLAALWQWMWFDTVDRVNDYLKFHLRHYGILFYYFGKIYDDPFAPWHAPFVMTAITLPPLTLLAGLGGTGLALWQWARRCDGDSGQRHFLAFVLANALVTAGTVAFLGSPKYGGVKLFLTFFPFWAILAAHGCVRAGVWLTRIAGGLAAGAWKIAVQAAPGALAVLAGLWASWQIHPYYLSYYSGLIGGLQGADKTGFESQYYDVFYHSLVRWLNTLPKGTRVFFEPNNKEYIRQAPWYRRTGLLNPDVRITGSRKGAHYVVLTHEKRWPQYESLRASFADSEPVHELRVEGVPLYSIYKTR